MAAVYFPSWVEVAVSIGIVGYGLLAFTLGVRYLPLFPEEVPESEEREIATVAVPAVGGD